MVSWNVFEDENPFLKWFTVSVQVKMENMVDILNVKAYKEDSYDELKNYYCDREKNIQYLSLDYFRYVPFEEIIINAWSDIKLEKTLKIVDELNTAIIPYNDKKKGIVIGGGNLCLPRIGRSYFYNERPGKYKIIDGNHRIEAARLKGFSGIMCNCNDLIKFVGD